MVEKRRPTIFPKTWGEEQHLANRDFCVKLLVVKFHFRVSIHHHQIKDETFYLLTGRVLLEVDGEAVVMEPGDIVDIPPGTKHRYTGLEDSVMIEGSTHDEPSDSYRDTVSERVPDEEFAELQTRYAK